MTLETHDAHHHPTPGADRSVRPAIAADAQRIAELQVASLQVITGTASANPDAAALSVDTAQIADQWRQSLSGPKPDGFHTLVALHGHGIAGFAFAAPGQELPIDGRDPIPAGTDIHELVVDVDFARSGHGSRLLQAVADITDSPCLRVWITAGDEPRTRFYQSAGFAPAGLRRCLGAPDATATADLVQHLWWALR